MRKITNCLAGLSQQAQQISWDKEEGEDRGCYSIALIENCKALQVFLLKIEIQGDYSLQMQITNVIALERNYRSLMKFSLAIHIPQKRYKPIWECSCCGWMSGHLVPGFWGFLSLMRLSIKSALLQSIQVQSERKKVLLE